MHCENNQNSAADARVAARLSRRIFLQFAAAGSCALSSCASLPAAAEAGPERLSGGAPVERTDDQQLAACIGQLRAILRRMHPGCVDERSLYLPRQAGGGMVLIELLPESVFDGEGFYEVEERSGKHAGSVYWITREWSDMDRRSYLWGAYVWQGERCGPREVIEPRRIVRKLEGGAA